MVFVPATIVPAPRRHGTLSAVRAGLRNPLEYWSQPFFEGDVIVDDLLGRRFVTVTGPALAQTVLHDRSASFKKSSLVEAMLKPLLGTGLSTSHGAQWQLQRRILTPLFRPARIEEQLPVFDACADRLVERLLGVAGEAPVDVLPILQRASLDVALDALFGGALTEEERDTLRLRLDLASRSLGRSGLPEILGFPGSLRALCRREGVRLSSAIRAQFRDMLRARRKDPRGGDFLGQLLTARDPETGAQLSEDALADNLMTFLVAGHETTALALAWCLGCLAHLPDLQEELGRGSLERQDTPPTAQDLRGLPLHARVMNETLRLYPSAAAIVLTPVGRLELAGHALKPGDHVSVAIYVIHRHRAHWDRPDAFDPDRFLPERSAGRHPWAFLPYGGGPRVCTGRVFATQELVIMLERLMRRLRVAPVGTAGPLPRSRGLLRPMGGMPLYLRAF